MTRSIRETWKRLRVPPANGQHRDAGMASVFVMPLDASPSTYRLTGADVKMHQPREDRRATRPTENRRRCSTTLRCASSLLLFIIIFSPDRARVVSKIGPRLVRSMSRLMERTVMQPGNRVGGVSSHSWEGNGGEICGIFAVSGDFLD